ncbi:MAG: phage terminase small subunit P27 family [Bacillota bacterium]|nr:phage terminase small subunit P27 family [Bacillota bacterium]
MGKLKKPIDMQKAHLTLVEKQNRRQEEESVVTGNNQLKTPPKWLINDTAKKEWRRIVKELNKIDIVGNLDYANLGGYCNAYANYIKATEILKDQTYYIDRETRTGVIVVKNPMVDIQTNYAAEMRKFASLCGLTIDSRLKAAVTKTEKTEDMIQQKFGNI